MTMADLKRVDADNQNAQMIAILEEYGRLDTTYAEIPQAGQFSHTPTHLPPNAQYRITAVDVWGQSGPAAQTNLC